VENVDFALVRGGVHYRKSYRPRWSFDNEEDISISPVESKESYLYSFAYPGAHRRFVASIEVWVFPPKVQSVAADKMKMIHLAGAAVGFRLPSSTSELSSRRNIEKRVRSPRNAPPRQPK